MRQLETIWERKHLFALLDLDRFKAINDTLGHDAGDQLLVETAERLRSCQRAEDVVARLGGDEFVVVLNGLRRPEDAPKLAKSIRVRLARSIEPNGQQVSCAASIGIALSADAGSPEQLLSNADIAMYHAKLKKGKTSVFDSGMKGRRPPSCELNLLSARSNGLGGTDAANGSSPVLRSTGSRQPRSTDIRDLVRKLESRPRS